MRLLPYFILLVILAQACKRKNNYTLNHIAHNNIEVPEKKSELIDFDTSLTDLAYLIAGLKPMSNRYNDIVVKDFYQKYAADIEKSWLISDSLMLQPIKRWLSERQISDNRDSLLCFYPLSGPDFLFGNAFWPNAQTYIMLGLEPKGTLVNFTGLNDTELKKYFNGIKESLKYLNTRGYFVTMHMSSDFTKMHLNGMLHMILFMLARTNHFIKDIYYVQINKNGDLIKNTNPPKKSDTLISATAIDFLDAHRQRIRTVYYFQLNANDNNLNKHPEFEKFVLKFKNRVAYMKSASCVLQNTPFSTIRKLVLGCKQILQDDTGVPYRYFDSTKYDITLYGTYTSTIKDLSWCLQKDLMNAIKRSPHNHNLPFKISYNGNYGEGMLLHAVGKE
jgi:hypothetical protein